MNDGVNNGPQQVFSNPSGGHMIADIFHFPDKAARNKYIPVEQQKLSAQRNRDSFVPVLKAVKFIGAKKQIASVYL